MFRYELNDKFEIRGEIYKITTRNYYDSVGDLGMNIPRITYGVESDDKSMLVAEDSLIGLEYIPPMEDCKNKDCVSNFENMCLIDKLDCALREVK